MDRLSEEQERLQVPQGIDIHVVWELSSVQPIGVVIGSEYAELVSGEVGECDHGGDSEARREGGWLLHVVGIDCSQSVDVPERARV